MILDTPELYSTFLTAKGDPLIHLSLVLFVFGTAFFEQSLRPQYTKKKADSVTMTKRDAGIMGSSENDLNQPPVTGTKKQTVSGSPSRSDAIFRGLHSKTGDLSILFPAYDTILC